MRFIKPIKHGAALLVLGALALCGSGAKAQTLLSDEFSGPTFNKGGQWGVYQPWQFLQRTQFGLSPQMGSESGVSFARLPLRSYNDGYDPQRPTTQGTEIFSKNAFKVGTGIEFEARLRGFNVPRGVVFGLYTYSEKGRWPDGYLKEEIDFENVSNLPTNQFWSNIWNDWNGRYPYNDGVHNSDGIVTVAGLNNKTWTTYTARWYPDRVEWYVNGVLSRTSKTVVPDDPMSVHFNIWAPESGWSMAYDPFLQPTNDPSKSYNCAVDVDYVRVKRLPAPTKGTWGTGDGLRAQYFPAVDFTGQPITRIDRRLFHDWGSFSPDVNIPNDKFSARWSGFIQSPFTENVTLTLRADDGVRLYLNNQLQINDWRDTAPVDRTFTIPMQAGVKVPLRVEYYENSGGASAQLSWQSASMPKTVVPQSQLYSGDTLAPTIAISSPASGASLPGLSAISGTASDLRSDPGVTSAGALDRVTISLKRAKDGFTFDGTNWSSAAVEALPNGLSTWNLPLPTLDLGSYSLSASATDMAGNRVVSPVRTFTIVAADKTPPSLTVTSPGADYSYRSLGAATGTASDSGTGVSVVQSTLRRASDGLYWNGSAWSASAANLTATLSAINWSLNLSFLGDDKYTLTTKAIDNAGNVSPLVARDFWIDTIAPVTTIVAPINGAKYASLAAASGTARDSGPGIGRVSLALMRSDGYFWNGSTWSASYAEVGAPVSNGSGAATWNFTLPVLPATSYVLWAQSYDYVGNVGPWTRSDFGIGSGAARTLQSGDVGAASAPVS